MKTELDRIDIESLVKGMSPFYELRENEIIKELGYVNGSQDTWE